MAKFVRVHVQKLNGVDVYHYRPDADSISSVLNGDSPYDDGYEEAMFFASANDEARRHVVIGLFPTAQTLAENLPASWRTLDSVFLQLLRQFACTYHATKEASGKVTSYTLDGPRGETITISEMPAAQARIEYDLFCQLEDALSNR